ncbi:hypothetical protein ACH5RR_011058 [Cinchona calisaya]|uniref:Gnk2-homologous domain-containing protein n=1 Tax=Cinchona calisaya TaxID=153742 RepID=A0ABD3A6E9_9GENT
MGDPRVELVYKACGNEHAQNVSEFNDNYAKVMVSMQDEMLRNKFATGEEGKPPNRVYVLAQCMNDLSKDDCTTCFSNIRTQLPGCFPKQGGRIFFDGCFLRVDNYSFFNEFSSPADQVRCSDAKNINSPTFTDATIEMITKLVAKAPIDQGYAVGDGLPYNHKVYGMANGWRTLDPDSCSKCLSNASKAILHCLPSEEARALNVGCYLRYADSEFANHPASSSTEDAIFVYLSFVLGAVAICLLAIMIGYFSGIAIYRRQLNSSNKIKGLKMESSTIKSLQFNYSRLEKATENFSEGHKIGQETWRHFEANTLQDIIDPNMEIEYLVDIIRVVQIALLCTQELPDIRPNMTAVILMLSEKELELPVPSKPPFLDEHLTDDH